MSTPPDEYLIPAGPAAGEFRDRGSKFVAALEPVRSEEEALAIQAREQQLHHKCNHHCYAYRIGEGTDRWRANDDGEPSGTAGKPILGQIDKAGLSDCVIVVSRYFGGTKLGASGLINAYREAARLAVESAPTKLRPLTKTIVLEFGYDHMSAVMGTISHLGLEMIAQDFQARARVQCEVLRSRAELVVRELKAGIAGVYLGEVDDEFAVEGVEVRVKD